MTWDKVDFIHVRTINTAGEVFELEMDDMSNQTYTTWAIPDQDQRCWVYNVKGAEPGAIIEEHYKITTSKILGVGGFWFQDRDPVVEASYTLDTPSDYVYKWKVKNIDITPEEKKHGSRITRIWRAKDVPPVIEEDGMVAPDDIVAQVKIANEYVAAFAKWPACRKIDSWEAMGRCWNEMIKERQVTCPAIDDTVAYIAKKAKDDIDKVRLVWRYMNENIRYVGLERGLAGFVPLSASVVCSKKYGDCKAVAGLITVLCRKLGLRADPILIGTRPQLGDLDTELPGPFHFNHSIARVEAGGKVFWLDATNRYSSFDTTPYADQGVHVIVAFPEKPFLDFVPVQPPEQNSSEAKVVFTPAADGSVEMEMERTTRGNTAMMLRSASYQYNAKQWRDMIDNTIASSYPQAKVLEQSYEGKENNDEPFVIRIKARIEKAMQPAGAGVSFQVKELFPSSAFDYFTLPKRHHPLDLGYLWTRKSRFEVVIPEGMDASGLPRNVTYDDDFVSVERLTQIEGNRVVTELKWKSKKLIIKPDEYPAAREAYLKVLDATSFVVLFQPAKKKS
ncbi:MAG: DUF3857 domain-containing protein [Deltaproteobacteria bacterium]|nr:MAG: DUF3857 domain-containing protein [Deltaproteobacteria bacterium]